MCGICLPTYITDDAPAAPASFANFVHCDAKTVARGHSTSDHRSAIRAHDHAVVWPARRREVERARTHVCLQLGRSADMRKAERLCVDGPASNKNGQATSGPAMLVQRGVYVDHQALPQTAVLPLFLGRLFLGRLLLGPFASGSAPGFREEPNTMLRPCRQVHTRSGVSRPVAVQSPSRGSRHRRAGARPWSYRDSRKARRTRPGRRGICPAGSNRAEPSSPRLPRSL